MIRMTVQVIWGRFLLWPYMMAKLPRPPAPRVPATAVKLMRETMVMVTPRVMPGTASRR